LLFSSGSMLFQFRYLLSSYAGYDPSALSLNRGYSDIDISHERQMIDEARRRENNDFTVRQSFSMMSKLASVRLFLACGCIQKSREIHSFIYFWP
jgi:hypothetical protein